MMHKQILMEQKKQEKLCHKKNKIDTRSYNGIFNRYKYPILTKDHVPVSWRFDLDLNSNPYGIERLGVNSVFNSGAIFHEGYFYLITRLEGTDRKSIFALARSKTGIDHFNFIEPITFNRLNDETNLYDMRLTKHIDGYIYGLFCSESLNKEKQVEMDAIASAGVVRTKDLKTWERLPNIETKSPQQRNVILHPEFVNNKYLLYTRPQEGFIDVGTSGGISYGFVEDMNNPVIEVEKVIDKRVYHTVYETKNGGGIVPIKDDTCYMHIVHGVRNTAAGLRYVLYAFATDLVEPYKIISKPSGYLMAPENDERIGDVSNVLFSCGAVEKDGIIYLYYASSDTKMHVATINKLAFRDYLFNNPKESFNTFDSTNQRIELINKNKAKGNL
jgi:4-O-beta-D-mannosyl-D-glucose phosphorylase